MNIQVGFEQLNLDDNVPTITNLDQLKEMIYLDPPSALHACISLRKMISSDKCKINHSPLLESIVSLGFVPRLLDLVVKTEGSSTVRHEACWVIASILSGAPKHVKLFVQAGGLAKLFTLVSTYDEHLRELIVWALGNIASNSANYRDLVLQTNVLPLLLEYLQQSHSTPSFKRRLVQAVKNLCHGKPRPNMAVIGKALPVMVHIITSADSSADIETVADALWAISYLSDGDDQRIDQVANSGVVPSVIQLLHFDNTNILVPAIRIFCNLMVSDDNQIAIKVLSMNPLPALSRLLVSPNHSIVKETVWGLSNILASNSKEVIQLVIDGQIMQIVVDMLANNSTQEGIRMELLWCVANVAHNGSAEQVNYIFAGLNGFALLCSLLDADHKKNRQFFGLVVNALDDVFKNSGAYRQLYVDKFLEQGALNKLQSKMSNISDEEVITAWIQVQEYFRAVVHK